MKRFGTILAIGTVLAILLLLFSFGGCDTSDKMTNIPAPPSTLQEKKSENDYFVSVVEQLKQEAKKDSNIQNPPQTIQNEQKQDEPSQTQNQNQIQTQTQTQTQNQNQTQAQTQTQTQTRTEANSAVSRQPEQPKPAPPADSKSGSQPPSQPSAASKPSQSAPAPQPANPASTSVSGSVAVGATKQNVLAFWGNPTWKGITPYGEELWVYESNKKFSRAVYFLNEKVEGFVISAGKYGDLTIGSSLIPPPETLSGEYEGVSFTVKQTNRFGQGRIYLASTPGGAVELFVDKEQNNKILYIRVSSWEKIFRERRYHIVYQYREPKPDWLNAALSAKPSFSNDVERTEERYLAALINDHRAKNGLSILSWDEKIAEVARSHSRDMRDNNFFSHVSPTTGRPADRMTAAGIPFKVVGENIAAEYYDALDVHVGFLNSPGHRANLDYPSFTHFGIGVSGQYWTENFVGR
ncbi:MAG: CAP domain-containing protein [Brockia lithotrophica]|nr:CAP domain-containing protein [Brockia lithotrophica]